MFSLTRKCVTSFFAVLACCWFAIGASDIGKLPHCVSSEPGFVLISTLDGKLTSVDATGTILWEIDTDPGPLLTSNIHDLELTNNGELVRIIPSLTGSLYKFNGKTIDAIPINADVLLKSSFLYSNDLVIAGSRDVRTYGIMARTGETIYECSSDGCQNKTKPADEFEDIVLVERSTITIRAHEPRTGHERWNYSVGSHNIKIPQASCINLDMEIVDLNLTAVLPKGILTARRKDSLDLVWQKVLTSPIVKVWKYDGRDLQLVDFFHQAKPVETSILLSPAIYLGMHNKQLYIHESARMLQDLEVQIYQKDNVVESKIQTRIPWKPISAGEIEEAQDDTTALSVLYSSQYINGNGYYLYTENDIKKKNTVLCGTNRTRKFFKEYLTEEPFYLTQIFIISVISVFVINFFYNFGLTNRFREMMFRNAPVVVKESMESAPVHTPSVSTDKSERSYSESSDTVFTSRFEKDFLTVRCLGRGGFGIVYEVKQKIDECGYAIKRIALPKQNKSKERVLREVKALATLDHNNIVRYSTSWVECPPMGWEEEFDRKWMGETSFVSTVETETTEPAMIKKHTRTNSFVITFRDKTVSNDDGSCKIEFEKGVTDYTTNSITSSEPSAVTNMSCSDQSNIIEDNITYLYIQMQLCKKNSLKEWLNVNPDRQKDIVLDIYKQILNAVEYVHSKQLIHRDLKPSNIFFSQDDTIKVGDFGLVTSMVNTDMENNSLENSKINYTKGAGTFLYMSPEQIERKEYNYKVDIFSLGIILFELLVPFSTEAERYHVLKDLRAGIIPESFIESYPFEHYLLKMMLSNSPSDRPDSTKVKELLFSNDEFYNYCYGYKESNSLPDM